MTRRVCLTCRHWLRMKDDQMIGLCQDTDDLPVHSYRGQLEDCTTGGWAFGKDREVHKQGQGVEQGAKKPHKTRITLKHTESRTTGWGRAKVNYFGVLEGVDR